MAVPPKEVFKMSVAHETELESEFELGLHETELEGQPEGEGIFGAIGNALGGLLGEGESTGESEGELEFESEFEGEGEFNTEYELEFEAGEQVLDGVGRFLTRAAPVLKQVALAAAPIVGNAIGGPVGTAIGGLASSLLDESEFELEGEFEGEAEFETEFEGESEAASEIASHQMTAHEALSEMMAEAASQVLHEGEAEAMAGAAVITVLSPRDRRALCRLLPHLIRGAAVLTRILRRRRSTRPAVRAVPTIMRRAVKTLKRQAAAGRPITRRAAARATASEVRRVLCSPRAVRASIARNMRAGRAMRRPTRRHRSVAG
jgi:hypothetical protein